MAYTDRDVLNKQRNIRKLKRNISNRLKRLKDVYGGGDIESKIIRRFENKFKSAITDKDGNVIRIGKNTPTSVLREVEKNLIRLDTKGATHAHEFELYNEIIGKCVENGIDVDEAFQLYDRLVSEGLLLANYKYEIVNKIVDYKINGLTDQEISDFVHKTIENFSGSTSTRELDNAFKETEKFYDYTSWYIGV